MSLTPDPNRIAAIVEFAQAAERLKDTLRTGVTRGGRPESTAEHSWRLCLMAMLFSADMRELNLLKLIKLCVVHDLGEAISGDIPAPLQVADAGRMERERADLATLCRPLPDDLRDDILALWDEYSMGQTAEAAAAKGLDKLETMLQHLIGQNPPDFDYSFNLGYGRRYTDRHPVLATARQLVDDQTRMRIA